MPQPALDVKKYLTFALPSLAEKYPPGTGGTGPRAEWPEGTLKGVETIDEFGKQVNNFMDKFPSQTVNPNPYKKYPKFVQVTHELPNPIRNPGDLQKALALLPLASVASVLTALESGPQGWPYGPRTDAAGYESDGGEEAHHEEERRLLPREPAKEWAFRYSKSPMGSGELLLVKGETNDVNMVVRTINSAAFAPADWEEFAVTGPYHYNTKSKASWYWSRTWGACKRLQTKYWVLTDWQRWMFGVFNEDGSHAFHSPILHCNEEQPTILEALFYWASSSKKAENGFQLPKPKDVSSMAALFPSNPARRVSVSGRSGHVPRDPSKVKAANESDIEESDAE